MADNNPAQAEINPTRLQLRMREVAAEELAPDWYNRSPEVADAVFAEVEPLLRELLAEIQTAPHQHAHLMGSAAYVRVRAALDASEE